VSEFKDRKWNLSETTGNRVCIKPVPDETIYNKGVLNLDLSL